MTDVKKPYENMLVRKSQDGSNGVYVEFNDTANTAAQKERLAVTTTVAALGVSDDSLALAVLHHARDQQCPGPNGEKHRQG